MIGKEEQAEFLLEAMPYIEKYQNKILVVKYGGNAMTDDTLKQLVMRDMTLLRFVGIKVVLVHGGGPEITETLKKMNIESEFVNGLRKTDRATVDVVQMVLAGKVNKNLVNLIENTGGKAIGLCGLDGHMIEAAPLSAALGYVGEITKINAEPVLDVLNAGYVPVVSTVGCDKEGNVYNINADTVAAALAGSLRAACMISMTDIAGILRDKGDEKSLIPVVHVSEAPALMREGVISGGMIPKVECCVEAIRRGVEKVFVIDGRVPHSILIEMFSDEGIGTMFY